MAEKNVHEELSEAGRKGGEASHSRKESEGKERQGMSRKEAGRLGGEKVAEERGSEFFRTIGKKGGQTVAQERGREFYSMIGKMGAKAEPHEAKVRGGEHSHRGAEHGSGSVGELPREKRVETGHGGMEARSVEARKKSDGRSHSGKG